LWTYNDTATITQTMDPAASNTPTTSTKKDENEKNGTPCDGDTINGQQVLVQAIFHCLFIAAA